MYRVECLWASNKHRKMTALGDNVLLRTQGPHCCPHMKRSAPLPLAVRRFCAEQPVDNFVNNARTRIRST